MKIKVGIIGTGNIGTDLLIKCNKSRIVEPVIFVGRRKESNGIDIANRLDQRFKNYNVDRNETPAEFKRNPSGPGAVPPPVANDQNMDV